MTIEELSEMAQETCKFMAMEMARDRGTLERASQFAQVASAAAQTAQMMMQQEQRMSWAAAQS